MNRFDLKQKLISERVLESAYSLDGGLPSDKYVLSDDGYGNWSVYYSERGERIGEKKFSSESDACKYLLEKLLADPTTRSR